MRMINDIMNEQKNYLDAQLWHACAGGMVQLPPMNSKVFYFPQGHAEHSNDKINFSTFPRGVPSLVPCRVANIKFSADNETDEVFAKMTLVPLGNNDEGDFVDDKVNVFDKTEGQEKPTSFTKTLTQSDANNGGGFSVPRYCAETIFPRLDYSADPPVQTLMAKDVHGYVWKFRHIYRGTPRRHLLTTGWSNFINQKKLVAGDSIVFLRSDDNNNNGELFLGIRRAKREIRGGYEYSSFVGEDSNNNGRLKVESVVEAVILASKGEPFEVVYYPRASAPEFCVKASLVSSAMRIQWCAGMRFKMPFETEDSSRISWFMGTISCVQVENPVHWPNSPWRLLLVAWDEPDLLQNVKRVSPWLLELVSTVPAIHFPPFSPPRKKLRMGPHSLQAPDFPFIGQFQMGSSFMSNNALKWDPNIGRLSGVIHNNNNIYHAGIQGVRHNLHFTRLHSNTNSNPQDNSVSCSLTIGTPTDDLLKKTNFVQKPSFLLFGQPILTEDQISQSSSSDCALEKTPNLSDGSGSGVVQNDTRENLSDDGKSEFELGTGYCKVFMESDNVGRTLDFSALGSYEELYVYLANMFRLDASIKMLKNMIYWDSSGVIKHPGDEPFSDFLKTAKRLTVLMDSGSNNIRR